MDGMTAGVRTPGTASRSSSAANSGNKSHQQLPSARYVKHSSGGPEGNANADSDSEDDYVGENDETQQLRLQQNAVNAANKRSKRSTDQLTNSQRNTVGLHQTPQHNHHSTTPGDEENDYNRPGSGGNHYANPNLLPPEYYPPNSYANNVTDHHYDNRRPTPRRVPASVSSSDNNSDTTYAESGDINSSLRARMHALDNQLVGSPELLPTEVLQRISPHHLIGIRGNNPQQGGGMDANGPPHPANGGSGGGYQPSTPDDGYQQPQNTVFLSHDYMMGNNGLRYQGNTLSSRTGGTKSPGAQQALYCTPSPTREYYTHNIGQPQSQEFYYYQQVHPHQHQVMGTLGTLSSTKTGIGTNPNTNIGSGGVGFATLPVVRHNLGSRAASLTNRRLSLGGSKSWHRVFSWRCSAIVLSVICCILLALVAYLAATASISSNTRGCILVQGDEGFVKPGEGAALLPPTTRSPAYGLDAPPPPPSSSHHSNQQSKAKVSHQPRQHSLSEGLLINKAHEDSTELVKMLNKRYVSVVQPNDFWNVQFEVKQPMLVRINLTVPRSSYLAVYGRRNVAPSITQYDFVQFIKSGRATRLKRDVNNFKSDLDFDIYGQHLLQDNSNYFSPNDSSSFTTPTPKHHKKHPHHHHHFHNHHHHTNSHHHFKQHHTEHTSDINIFQGAKHSDYLQKLAETRDDFPLWLYQKDEPLPPQQRSNPEVRIESPHKMASPDYTEEEEPVERWRRYVGGELSLNVSLHHHMNTGLWYMAFYNDALTQTQIALVLEEAGELQSECPNDCSGHGSCVLGRCECNQGWVGHECSTSVCPVLCSSHGQYGGGVCHCNPGWKGRECDVPDTDCEVPDCGGKGTCYAGRCHCSAGWKGLHCDQEDCLDPQCGGHGGCVAGECVCQAGWTGRNCSEVDHKVFTCLPDCSGHGHYDLHSSKCICESFWTGDSCNQPWRCEVTCIHGSCGATGCICDAEWAGERCDQRSCDSRCAQHGQCNNGTCVCIQGWNGRHCTIPGCVNSCSGHGLCTIESGEYSCQCSAGWTGKDCSVQLETECNDLIDNDGDGLVDCSDSDCCWTGACTDHVMCMVSTDPVEVLLRRQPMSVTASFYQRVKFLIEDRNVQSFARESVFKPNRVAVIRGRVVSSREEGIGGVRTSVDKEAKYGLTATRSGGWFDILVNGGGAVTLMFQRANFEAKTVTVPLIWNDIMVLDPIVLMLKSQSGEEALAGSISKQWNSPCMDHDERAMRPHVVSTHLPHTIGGAPQKPVIFTEMQVVQESLRIPGTRLHLLYHSNSVAGYHSRLLIQLTPSVIPVGLNRVHLKITLEGTIYEKLFEADPNITFTYTWNKRNIYKSKIYDVAIARVYVGYEYSSCSDVVWTIQTAPMHGFHMAISDVGGWNLDIHHMYNFETGVLQRGDGSLIELRRASRIVSVAAGTGWKRDFECVQCEGLGKDAKLLAPTTIAAAPDGSVYVGDFNLIRRITPDGKIYTVLQLSATEVSYEYYMAVSPSDGQLYVSDAENHRIIRILSLEDISDPSANFEVVAGSEHRCIPGDEGRCGDGGPAISAKLSHPKGLAISADRTIYIADGRNLRAIDPEGKIHTLIGHHGHKTKWRQLPCEGVISASDVDLQWPTHLAVSPLDDTLHLLDDHVLMQVTKDGRVVVRAGNPMHCPSSDLPHIGTISGISFAPYGSLYLAQQTSSGHNSLMELTTSDEIKPFAGSTTQHNQTRNATVQLASQMTLRSISGVAVTPDGVVYISDLEALKVYKLTTYLPQDDHNGDYLVAHPPTNEIYVFNRHGHHIETRDLMTGNVVYSFTYSKNTSVGRLSQVTDAAGNKAVFFRDYRSAVSHIENSLGEKFPVHIGRLGLMTQFTGRAARSQDFNYDEETGLLVSKTSPGLLTTIYKYDSAGRVTDVFSPTGSLTSISSWMGEVKGRSNKLLTVGVSSEGEESFTDMGKNSSRAILSLTNDGGAYFSHGIVAAELHSSVNGSWKQILPWTGTKEGISAPANLMLELSIPSQAGLLGTASKFLVSPRAGLPPSSLTKDTVLRQTGDSLYVENKYRVNGSNVISTTWDGDSKTNLLRNSYGDPLLQLAYNNQMKPTSVTLGTGLPAAKMGYDNYGKLQSIKWSNLGFHYGYNENNLLASVKNGQSQDISYVFNEQRMLSSIKMPSGRAWVFKYDNQGGLSGIMMPSGKSHLFSVQATFAAFIFKYTPPGSTQAYRQHLDPSGKLLLTAYPDTLSKILYKYSDSGQLQSVVSGDGITTFNYGEDSLLSEVVRQDKNLEYKVDNLYEGKLLSEHRVEYSARSGLSNIKFIYDYDANMRITKMAGRIGGQKVKPLHISYNSKTGEPTNIGTFLIAHSSFNTTTVQDGTAIFTRYTDSNMRLTYVTLNIHNMQVFTQRISYDSNDKIVQTSTYTTSNLARPYTYTQDYNYDEDGQLISVSAKEPWNFSYDMNGNMVSLTYKTNTISMKYDSQDRIIQFGEGVYKYNSRGFIIQNAREVSFEYDSRGLLTKASKPERFTVEYLYDHERRLIARKDNFGNVTQFQYQDPNHPDRVSQIYNARDASLISLIYDDRGHLIFAQVQRNQYYIATDARGTPTIILNRFGEVVRQIMSSPYGTVIYDSNPYLYIPIAFCGGILDSQTELVHMPQGRVYDPLIGLWFTPQWQSVVKNLMHPTKLSLYRPNGNDPVNVKQTSWDNNDKFEWMELLHFDIKSLAPQLSWPSDIAPVAYSDTPPNPLGLWDSFTTSPAAAPRSSDSAFSAFVPESGECVSGLAERLRGTVNTALSLDAIKPSVLREDFWPEQKRVELSNLPGPFGSGVLVSRAPDGKAQIMSAPNANAIFRDVITSVFNGTHLLDINLYSHSLYTFYFVKPDLWKAKDDKNQLNRLAGEVNITQTSNDGGDEYIDVKLHTKYAVVHIRYGTTPEQEQTRLIKHAKKQTIRRAWAEERDRLNRGEAGSVPWTHDQRVELLTHGYVDEFTARYLHPPDIYPELVDDPSNIKFTQNSKRLGR